MHGIKIRFSLYKNPESQTLPLPLLDMRKDSDSVPRTTLLNGLEDITEYDELCSNKLPPDVKIAAKCFNYIC